MTAPSLWVVSQGSVSWELNSAFCLLGGAPLTCSAVLLREQMVRPLCVQLHKECLKQWFTPCLCELGSFRLAFGQQREVKRLWWWPVQVGCQDYLVTFILWIFPPPLPLWHSSHLHCTMWKRNNAQSHLSQTVHLHASVISPLSCPQLSVHRLDLAVEACRKTVAFSIWGEARRWEEACYPSV